MHKRARQAWESVSGKADFVRVASFGEFINVVGKFIKPRDEERNRFLFRGVPQASYDLHPLLARLRKGRPWLTNAVLHDFETTSTDEFKSKAHIVVDPRFMPRDSTAPGISLHWWQMMQHHGGATRLLDWTASQYVALYFAVCDDFDRDGAIWMVDYGAVHDRMHERYPKEMEGRIPLVERDKYPERSALKDLVFFKPCSLPNERMVAQSGWFSCASLPEVDHAQAISSVVMAKGKPGRWTQKILIAKEAKRGLCRDLWQMNITHATLFPGLDGLAQAFRRRADILQVGRIKYRFEDGLLAGHKL